MLKEPICHDKVTLLVLSGCFGGWRSLFMQHIFSTASEYQKKSHKEKAFGFVSK